MSDQPHPTEPVPGADRILTPDALAFVRGLHEAFGVRREHLLAARSARRGLPLGFLPDTVEVREAEWTVVPAPTDLQDRRVEITGPCDRKMTINALNSGARVWLADLEDASTPHWSNVVGGQVNLYDAIRRQVDFTSDEGKSYALNDDPLATIVMRPRGWHLDERSIDLGPGLADAAGNARVAGALVDFGLYFFHNAAELLRQGSGPYFYLPKMESHLEARLWNDVFNHAQDALGIPRGTIRATVLIETVPAAFEMDEILYELREHASGLNAGRWDYLFSMIKCFRDAGPEFVLPDRAAVPMTVPFLRSYAELLVKTCHRRGAFAMGGMSAFIPSRRDAEVNAKAFAQVKADKEREAGQGFDGSWVAHPDLVPICVEAFDAVLGDRPNQLDRQRDDVEVGAADLLDVASAWADGSGAITYAGMRLNVEVALLYLAAWLRGQGAVAIHNLMEDAATAEISRSQLWQWIYNGSVLDDGRTVTRELVAATIDEVAAELGDQVAEARPIFEGVVLDEAYVDFLTLPAYEAIDG
ncbi:malate synthase A [Nocardioides sp. GY 10113]|uniref:malate synthase A n=1 Tax=Nocardioides sp. GY 10113 TaxID=2569761 RepID=UPI0010A924D0|nr:malate synthase A [Nocardioides sp. GY 10113]TIC89132.1 malate synthase A [Nocardioides sp. GY 10113]